MRIRDDAGYIYKMSCHPSSVVSTKLQWLSTWDDFIDKVQATLAKDYTNSQGALLVHAPQ